MSQEYKIWFDHHEEGPYYITEKAESAEELEEIYADDPFFICVESDDSQFEPEGRFSVKLESAEALGELPPELWECNHWSVRGQ